MAERELPPHLKFFLHPVEDRNASIAAGHYVAKDVLYVSITRPGSRDSISREAEVWVQDQEMKAREGKVPFAWAQHFRASLEAWKKGEEITPDGTPLSHWPAIGPAMLQTMKAAGFRTVEELAAAPDNGLQALGPGGLNFKVKAKAWLAAAEDVGKTAERLSALEAELKDLRALNESLRADNLRLKAKVGVEKATA